MCATCGCANGGVVLRIHDHVGAGAGEHIGGDSRMHQSAVSGEGMPAWYDWLTASARPPQLPGQG